MVLQLTGPISLGNIASEFGGVVPHQLSEYYGKAIGVPTTGNTIRISDFYGKSNNPDPPTWITAANLGIVAPSTAFSKTVSASSDSKVTLSVVSSGFGTFSSTPGTGTTTTGTISGTTPNVSRQTYTWTIRATDAEGQTTDRTFSVLVSRLPGFTTSTNLGSYQTNTAFGIYISATSDSTVTYSIYSGIGSINSSNGYLSGTTPSYATNLSWTFRATDQEGQSVLSDSYTMSVTAPPPQPLIQFGISGGWADSGSGTYVYNNIYYQGDSTNGYFVNSNRPQFTLTVTGANTISMYFPDAGYVTGVVLYSGGQQYISQNNGTAWVR